MSNQSYHRLLSLRMQKILELAQRIDEDFPDIGSEYKDKSIPKLVQDHGMEDLYPKAGNMALRSALRYVLGGYDGYFCDVPIEPFDGQLSRKDYQTYGKLHKSNGTGHDFETAIKSTLSRGQVPWKEHGITEEGIYSPSDVERGLMLSNLLEFQSSKGVCHNSIAQVINIAIYDEQPIRTGNTFRNASYKFRSNMPQSYMLERSREQDQQLSMLGRDPSWHAQAQTVSGRIIPSDAEIAKRLYDSALFTPQEEITQYINWMNYFGKPVRTAQSLDKVLDSLE